MRHSSRGMPQNSCQIDGLREQFESKTGNYESGMLSDHLPSIEKANCLDKADKADSLGKADCLDKADLNQVAILVRAFFRSITTS